MRADLNLMPNNQPKILSIVPRLTQDSPRTTTEIVIDALERALVEAKEAAAAGKDFDNVVICFSRFYLKDTDTDAFQSSWITGNIDDLAAVGLLHVVARDLMGG